VNVFAADLGITSVIYDNSSSLLTINSQDNESYNSSIQPKITIQEEEQKAYFDINAAVLNCKQQNLIINSAEIKGIQVKQFSLNPNIVRVVIEYNKAYNPKDIHLLQLNNTLFVRFKPLKMTNYYLQHIYSDISSAISDIYETTTIQTPIFIKQDSILNQINTAFNINQNSNEKNYILSKKDLILPSRYYISRIDVKPDAIHITGTGSASFTKPIYLSNPTRVAFDIKSAIVRPEIRNKEIQFNNNESIKIGQFDKNTARIVITSPQVQNYIPVFYGDTQHLAFINRENSNLQNLFSTKSTLTSVNDEINDDKTHSMKLIFSKPIIYGIERDSSGLSLYLYNIEKANGINLKKSLIFNDAKFTAIKNGGFKFSITDKGEDTIDIHTGADGKTIRIKEKCNRINLPQPKNDPVIAIEPVKPQKVSDRYYIVIDPGHGGSDCGATRNGIYEKNITLDVSKRVTELLRKKGYDVRMTRENDQTVSLQDRVEFSENIDPDAFVSIHVNSSNSAAPNGLETHYYKENSLQLAKTVHASMLNHISANNRGLFKSKFYVINHTTAPAILVEIGFISNASERAQLVSESRKQATAKAIAEGINDYFKKQK